MKTISLKMVFLLLLLPVAADCLGDEISEWQAMEVARQFFKERVQNYSPLNKVSEVRRVSPHVSASAGANVKSSSAYYIFQPESGERGFVIVSADDELKSIVGYSDDAIFDESNVPVQLVDFLEEYERGVSEVRKGVAKASVPTAGAEAVAPLLTTKWGQGEPFNMYCVGEYTNGKAYPAGCVATAVAQVMKHHNYPPHGNCVTPEMWGWETLDLSKSVYDWGNMKNRYENGTYTDAEAMAVARLMRDIGGAVEMMYNAEESGAYTYYIVPAMLKYFNYSEDIATLDRRFYSTEEWIGIIRENLLRGEPLVYSGSGKSSAHAFVCDGIDSNNYLHINWGWNGSCDGYFDVDALSPAGVGIGGGDGNYYRQHTIVSNIRPGDPEADYSGYIRALVSYDHKWLSDDNSSSPLKKKMSYTLYNISGSYIRAGATRVTGNLYDKDKKLVKENIGQNEYRYQFREWDYVNEYMDVDFSGVDDGDYLVGLRWWCETSTFPGYNQGTWDYSADLGCMSKRYLEVSIRDGVAIVSQEEESVEPLTVESAVQNGVAYDAGGVNVKVKVRNNHKMQFLGSSGIEIYCVPEEQWSENIDHTQLTRMGYFSPYELYGGATKEYAVMLDAMPAGHYRLLFVYGGKQLVCEEPCDVEVSVSPTDVPFILYTPFETEAVSYRNGPYEWMKITMSYIVVDSWKSWYDTPSTFRFMASPSDDPTDEFILFEVEDKYISNFSGLRTQVFENIPGVEWRAPGKYRYWIEYRQVDGADWITPDDANNFGYFTLVQDDPSGPYLELLEPMVINGGQNVLPGMEFAATCRFRSPTGVSLSADNSWAHVVSSPSDWNSLASCWDIEIDNCNVEPGGECVMTMRFTMPENEAIYGKRFFVKPELSYVDENNDSWQVQVIVGDYMKSMTFVYNPAGSGLDVVEREPDKIDYNCPVEVYNLQGVMVSDSIDGLLRGFYIVRQGSATAKIAVR